jgi:hypothetical protein
MCSHFSDLLFVSFDSPEGADVISIDEAFLIVLTGGEGESRGTGGENKLSGYIHK